MGLQDAIKSAVQAAFTALDDMVASITYVQKTSSTYTPSTGTVVANDTEIEVDKALIYKAKSKQIDNVSVLKNDLWILIPVSDDFTITPKERDEIVINSLTYRIIACNEIITSGNVAWKIQARLGK